MAAPKDTYVYRVDLSIVLGKLASLGSPISVQRGKLAIFKEVLSVIEDFEKDKDFMKLYFEDQKLQKKLNKKK